MTIKAKKQLILDKAVKATNEVNCREAAANVAGMGYIFIDNISEATFSDFIFQFKKMVMVNIHRGMPEQSLEFYFDQFWKEGWLKENEE